MTWMVESANKTKDSLEIIMTCFWQCAWMSVSLRVEDIFKVERIGGESGMWREIRMETLGVIVGALSIKMEEKSCL